MNKSTLILVSLIAAIPGGVMTVLMVMAFVNHAGGTGWMIKALAGISLLTGAAVFAMPIGIVVFLGREKSGAAPQATAPDEIVEDEAEEAEEEVEEFEDDGSTFGADDFEDQETGDLETIEFEGDFDDFMEDDES